MRTLILLLVLGLLVSTAFAQECVSSSDCDDNSYCGSDGYCHSYNGDNKLSTDYNVSCCGAGFLLLGGLAAIVLTNQKR